MKQKLLHKESSSRKLSLLINIDGLLLFKSSSQQFWPILCNTNDWGHWCYLFVLRNQKTRTCGGIFVIDERKEILSTRFTLNDINYKVTLKAVTCDDPARSFLKCVVGHNHTIVVSVVQLKGIGHKVELHTMTMCVKQKQKKRLASCTTMITRKKEVF